MINVLSASLPGRCVMPTHYHASAAGMSDMLKLAAGQASYPGNHHMMKLDQSTEKVGEQVEQAGESIQDGG